MTATPSRTPVSGAGARQAVRRIVLLGNFPPRRCGIATFTSDVYEALTAAYPEAVVDVVAMIDEGGDYQFPPQVTATLDQDDRPAYAAMGRRIDALRPDVVCVQHEYGIFGGPAGDYLLDLLGALHAPVVTTLHTVLTDPNPDQRRVLDALAARSSQLIVMARKGVDILRSVYGVAADKIALVPHGAPDFPLSDTAAFKPRFGLQGRDLLFTFGLLSPNKGLELMIRALPAVVKARPNALYLVLGSTHPHLVAREGEAYREGLMRLAEELGVADHLRFVDSYADTDDLVAYLAAADVYVTPYLNEAQITSGTLSYAVALGKPVISTPYWHAQELLADGRGVLVPFGDSQALADAAISLLTDDARRNAIRAKAHAAGRETLWSRLAQRYMEAFGAAQDRPAGAAVVSLRPPPPREPLSAPVLSGLERLTDGCGILQHALVAVPNRSHGYCLDDNARALMLVNACAEVGVAHEPLERLAWTYAAFVQHAWDGHSGAFRNFMSYERAWLESAGSQDSFGRGFMAVALTAENGLRPELRIWAQRLSNEILPHLVKLTAPRAQAFAVIGLAGLIAANPADGALRALAGELAASLERELTSASSDDWRWFEDVLAYDNARLPQALLTAGRILERPHLVQAGLASLRWLCAVQTAPSGVFRPVGSDSFGQARMPPQPFDQQPLEAAATIDACAAAQACDPDPKWPAEARRAYDWYLGANDLGVRLGHPETGGCFDGLTPQGVNLNQGAESVLSYLGATCAMHRLALAVGGTGGERAQAK